MGRAQAIHYSKLASKEESQGHLQRISGDRVRCDVSLARCLLTAPLIFGTSEKMLLTRLQRWNLDRKNKSHEMAAALRKLRERAAVGKRSIISIRDRQHDEATIQDFARRKNMTQDELILLARTVTPPAVRCRSPSPIPISSPDIYRIPEILFASISARKPNENQVSFPLMYREPATDIQTWSPKASFHASYVGNCLAHASWYFKSAYFDRAGRYMRKAMDYVPNAIVEDSPLLVGQLVYHVFDLFAYGFSEPARMAIKHFIDFAPVSGLDQKSPLYRFCQCLYEAFGMQDFYSIAETAKRVSAEFYKREFGNSHVLFTPIANKQGLLHWTLVPLGVASDVSSVLWVGPALLHFEGVMPEQVTQEEEEMQENMDDILGRLMGISNGEDSPEMDKSLSGSVDREFQTKALDRQEFANGYDLDSLANSQISQDMYQLQAYIVTGTSRCRRGVINTWTVTFRKPLDPMP